MEGKTDAFRCNLCFGCRISILLWSANELALLNHDLRVAPVGFASSRAKRTIFERILSSLQTDIMDSSNGGNPTGQSPVSCRHYSYIQHALLRCFAARNHRTDVVLVLLFSRWENQTKDSLLLLLLQHLPLLLHHQNTSAVLRIAVLPTFRLPISSRWKSRFGTCSG